MQALQPREVPHPFRQKARRDARREGRMSYADQLILRDIQNLRAYADGARQRAEADVRSPDRATMFGGIGVALGALEIVAERAAKLAAAFERQCAMREQSEALPFVAEEQPEEQPRFCCPYHEAGGDDDSR